MLCSNLASDASSGKGFSLAVPVFIFLLQERQFISVHIDHIPQFRNDLADGLGRGYDMTQVCLAFPSTLCTHTYPPDTSFSDLLASA